MLDLLGADALAAPCDRPDQRRAVPRAAVSKDSPLRCVEGFLHRLAVRRADPSDDRHVAKSDARLFRRWARKAPAIENLVKEARRLKESVCAQDPYEQTGLRRVLNFGHSFGHVLESLSRFKLSHGDAVGLGMLCALDVGRHLGVTPPDVAAGAAVKEERMANADQYGRSPRTDRASHNPDCAD